jgi:hypothetical protein
VNGPVRLPAIDEDEAPRLAAFRAAHPEVVIGDLGFGKVWQARISEENGETVITRHKLSDLLDRLDVIFPGLPGPRGALNPPGDAARQEAVPGRPAWPAVFLPKESTPPRGPGRLARPQG